ncbi:hypothetical protein Btru_040119 [Bulinus truncatus]|nr:hypothetical protein Btru_040119 [Bulinus truncatus]
MLLANDAESDGVVNPGMEEELVEYYQSYSQSQTEGETSTAEIMEENEKAEILKSDLKVRHKRRKRDLSKLVSPKDDLTGELKTVKLDSRKKIEETELEASLAGVTDALEESSAPFEETTVTQPQEVLNETATLPTTIDETTSEVLADIVPSLEIPKDDEDAETEKPVAPDRRRSTIRERMKIRLAKAKEEEEAEFERQERVARKKSLKTKETRFEEAGAYNYTFMYLKAIRSIR